MSKNRIVCLTMSLLMLLGCIWLCGCSEAAKVKTGPSTYKKNYIYLNDYTMYVVEDITGTTTDPYHYKMYFHTDVLPDVEVKP